MMVMERIQAHSQVTQVSRQADSFKTGIERPLSDRFIGQGIQDIIRDAFSPRQVNDLCLATVHGITKEKKFKGWRFCVFVHAAFSQADIAECFNIDTDGFHTLHLEKKNGEAQGPAAAIHYYLFRKDSICLR